MMAVSGINYYGKTNEERNDHHLNISKNNEIHNNRFGFYSVNTSNILIENNIIHHDFIYGLGPHTGTHEIAIKNNTVHDQGVWVLLLLLIVTM